MVLDAALPCAPRLIPLFAATAVAARVTRARHGLHATLPGLLDEAWAGLRELALPTRLEFESWSLPSGRAGDFFAAAPYPALDVPLWLLADWSVPASEASATLEAELYRAGALAATLVLYQEQIVDAEAHYAPAHALAIAGLVARATALAAESVAPRGAAARARVQTHAVASWNAHGAALLAHQARRNRAGAVLGPRSLAGLGARWTPLETPVVAAAVWAGREADLPALQPLLAAAAGLFQLGRELASLNRDLARGTLSEPIARLARASAGEMLAAPLTAGNVLLAAVATPTLPELAADSLRHCDAIRARLQELGLLHTAAGLASLAEPFVQLLRTFGPAERDEPTVATASVVLSPRPQREQVLRAAEGCLRADPDYREAWEESRWGFTVESALRARVFPLGLVLEQRARAGDDCGAEIDALFDLYAANRFHYFDQPSALPPDSDTLGLMLRLLPLARTPARCRAYLATPLGWLEHNLAADGTAPTFLTRGVDAGDGRIYLGTMAGQRCAAVQAGLLTGLLAFDPQRHGELVARGAQTLFDLVATQGGAALTFYDVPFGALAVLDCAAAVREALPLLPGRPSLLAAISAAEARLAAVLRAHIGLARGTSLDAALLVLATRHAPAHSLADPQWLDALIRAQNPDGAWDAAPLYLVPHRGNLLHWYGSRLVSTAFCYRALRGATEAA